MSALNRSLGQRAGRSVLGVIITVIALTGLVAALTVEPGAAATKPAAPITLVFAGQVIGDESLEPFAGPYPPIEGGVAQVYTVPNGVRLVIDSVYADVREAWFTGEAGPRSGVTVGVSTWYDLGESCAYPGYHRSYGVPLTAPVGAVYDTENDVRRSGALNGPIFVEGGRSMNGNAFAPGGDSQLIVQITVHGRLEPATNPTPPVCGS